MAKATFLQRILQRPSQTYYDPAPKRYHSVKGELLQQAATDLQPAAPSSSGSDTPPLVAHDINLDDHNGQATIPEEDEQDEFFTPTASPTVSMHISPRLIAALLKNKGSEQAAVLADAAAGAEVTVDVVDADDVKKHRRVSSAPSIPEYVDLPPREQPQPQPPRAERDRRRAKTVRAPRPAKKDRMSALWEEEEPEPAEPLSRANSAASTATARTAPRRAAPVERPPLPSSAASSSSHVTSASTASAASTAGSGVIGGLGSTYSSLTLPRAAPLKLADPAQTLTSGRIDLAKDGRGQVTMTSVEVVRGVASSSSSVRSLGRKFSLRSAAKPKPGGNAGSIAADLALTSHRAPPSFVPNGSVLVHVHAVALEGLDLRLAREEPAGFVPGRAVVGRVVEAGVGVPREEGRRGEWVVGLQDPKKCGGLAEFILLDRHRVHRAPAPSVASSSTLFPPSPSRSGSPVPFNSTTPLGPRSRRSSSSSARSLAVLPRGPSMTELALLPLAVAVWRALRTWAPQAPVRLSDSMEEYDDGSELELPAALSRRLMMAGARGSPTGTGSPRGSGSPYVASPLASTPSLASGPRSPPRAPPAGAAPCALILQASSGAGALALVLLRAAHPHVRLIAHVPPAALGLAPLALPAPVFVDLQDWAALADAGLPLDARGADTLARLRALGAAAVVVGGACESLEAAAGAGEVGPAVDFVLDTAGGAAVWAAAAVLLGRAAAPARGEAMFATLVGSGESTRAVPSAQDHWRAARGPPRAHKGKRRVGWAWVPVSAEVDQEGQDVRAGLGAVMGALGVGEERGESKGRWRALGDVLGGEEAEAPFERAMDAFGPRLEGGRCVVVKVAGA